MQVIFSINFLLLKNTINAGRIFMQKRASIQNWYNARRKNLHQIHFGFNFLGGLFVTRPAHQGIGIIFCLLDPGLIKRVYVIQRARYCRLNLEHIQQLCNIIPI